MAQSKKRKGGKKRFFEVSVPLTATTAKLYGYSPEDFNNSVIKLDLTRNLRGKNVELRARVTNEKENLTSEIISLTILQSYIKKIMRRGIDYIEDSIILQSKDFKLRIKPFMLTRNRVSRAIKKEIRNEARRFIVSHSTIRNTKELFSEIMTNKLQKMLSQKIKKIYPLAFCEIRIIEVLGPAEKKKKPEKTNTLEPTAINS